MHREPVPLVRRNALSHAAAHPAPPVAPRPADRGGWSLSPLALTTIAVVAVLLAALYRFNLRRLWEKTNLIYGADAADWSHSTLVPVVGLLYLWLRRDDLLAAPVRPVLPATRLPWLLGGGMVLAFAAAVGWLFVTVAGVDLGVLQPLLIPALIAGVLAAVVDLGLTLGKDGLAGVGRTRAVLGLATLGVGVAGWLFMSFGPGESIVGPVPAGYAGPLFLAIGFTGALSLLLDWGLGILLSGMLLTGYGIWPGQNDYLKDLGMIAVIFGTVLTLCGWRVMAVAWFPILFLVCAIPWPGLVYSKVAQPLQFLAAKVATVVMNVAQVETYVEGTQIVLSKGGEEHVLNVAEACAGMRSLMTFITAGGVVGFVLGGERPMWQRLLIVASAVPIAIACNVGRVSGMGLSYFYVSEAVSQGFAHQLAGLVMLVPAFFMLLGVVWVLDNLFVEEEIEDDEPEADTRTPAGALA